MTVLDLRVGECIDSYAGHCSGPLLESWSRSGLTVAHRCAQHLLAHEERLDAVEAGLHERYPGWDTTYTTPPADFDPAYAGEAWGTADEAVGS